MAAEESKVEFVHTWTSGRFRAHITHQGDEKYCLVEVRHRKTGAIEYHVVSMPLSYHSMIIDDYEQQLDEKNSEIVEVHGGGIVRIDREAKTLKTYGRSGGYGVPDLEMVKKVLVATLPEDWTLDITTTMYIRG